MRLLPIALAGGCVAEPFVPYTIDVAAEARAAGAGGVEPTPGPGEVLEIQETTVRVEVFDAALAPYGEWTVVDGLGWAWVPDDPGYEPYTEGHWEYAGEEPVWVPYEPYGEVVSHYGRWAYVEAQWVWVPGTEWAPAWVEWRSTDAYVGWAPLPPIGWAAPLPEHCWVFVEPRHVFVSAPARHRVSPGLLLPRARLVGRTARAGDGRLVVRGPARRVFQAQGVPVREATARPDVRPVGLGRGVRVSGPGAVRPAAAPGLAARREAPTARAVGVRARAGSPRVVVTSTRHRPPPPSGVVVIGREAAARPARVVGAEASAAEARRAIAAAEARHARAAAVGPRLRERPAVPSARGGAPPEPAWRTPSPAAPPAVVRDPRAPGVERAPVVAADAARAPAVAARPAAGVRGADPRPVLQTDGAWAARERAWSDRGWTPRPAPAPAVAPAVPGARAPAAVIRAGRPAAPPRAVGPASPPAWRGAAVRPAPSWGSSGPPRGAPAVAPVRPPGGGVVEAAPPRAAPAVRGGDVRSGLSVRPGPSARPGVSAGTGAARSAPALRVGGPALGGRVPTLGARR